MESISGIAAGVFGLFIGSFLNVLADRLPRGESVLWDRSRCDHCKKTLRWFELIPVFSYVLQGGRCRRCRKPLSVRYPLSELVSAGAFLYLYSQYNNSPVLLTGYLLVFASLFVIVIADFTTQIIPDSMVIVGIIGSILTGPYILAGMGSFAFLYLIWAFTRGKGMGFGDVKFALVMGLFLGYPFIVIAYYVAFLTGALAGVILMLTGKKGWKSQIAFGPFLVLGTVVAFVWGSQISTWWKVLL